MKKTELNQKQYIVYFSEGRKCNTIIIDESNKEFVFFNSYIFLTFKIKTERTLTFLKITILTFLTSLS